MMNTMFYDVGYLIKVPECSFVQAFSIRILMLPALHDEGLVAIGSDIRQILQCLLVLIMSGVHYIDQQAPIKSMCLASILNRQTSCAGIRINRWHCISARK